MGTATASSGLGMLTGKQEGPLEHSGVRLGSASPTEADFWLLWWFQQDNMKCPRHQKPSLLPLLLLHLSLSDCVWFTGP